MAKVVPPEGTYLKRNDIECVGHCAGLSSERAGGLRETAAGGARPETLTCEIARDRWYLI